MASVEAGSTRNESGQRIRGRIEPKWGKRLPAALRLLAEPSSTQLEGGKAASPMVINLAPLLSLNDTYAQAGQIQSSKGQAEQQAIEGIGSREATGGPLEATGLLVPEGFFSVEA